MSVERTNPVIDTTSTREASSACDVSPVCVTVVDFLNEALTAELTAVNQYFLHAKMCEHWGYSKLGSLYRQESIDEMRDAEKLIDRILMLDGLPNLQRLNHVGVGETVEEQIRLNRDLEAAAVERYRRGVALCLAQEDVATRYLLEQLLIGEEHHLDWLETQLSVIEDIGIKLYKQSMLGESAE